MEGSQCSESSPQWVPTPSPGSSFLGSGDFWWPHPDAFSDLTVEESAEGWILSAPDDTELSAWIAYWDQDEAHHKLFEREFISALLSHITHLEQQNGKTEAIADE